MIAKFSVQKPLTIIMAVLMVIVLGFVSFSKMTPDLLPNINLPYAMVITSYPGATPEEVESKISKPLEQAMASLENINGVSSVSGESMSRIMLEFTDKANMDAVVPEIREKINGVSGSWDETVGTPFIIKLNPSLLPITVSAVEMQGKTNAQVTDFLNNELMSSLEGITGVASVSMSGNVEERVDVMISEDKLKAVNKKIKSSLDGEFSDAESELKDKENELNDGKAELDSKESELEGAKSQLESGRDELADKTSQGQTQLIDKKLELENAKLQLQGKIDEANTNIMLLEESQKLVSSLNDNYKQSIEQKAALKAERDKLAALQEKYAALLVTRTELELKIAALEQQTPEPTFVPTSEPTVKPTTAPTAEPTTKPTAAPTGTPEPTNAPSTESVNVSTTFMGGGNSGGGLTLLQTNTRSVQPSISIANMSQIVDNSVELERLKAELAAVKAEITAAETEMTAAGVKPETITARIVELEAQIAALDAAIQQIDETLKKLGLEAGGLDAAIAEMDENIGKLKTGVTQMEEAITGIETGSKTVSEALSELNKQQLQGSAQISEGLSQIISGQAGIASAKSQLDAAQGQIDTAKEDFDKQKTEAYKSASLEITMDMVSQILTAQNFSMPAGYITEDGTQYLVRVGDRIKDVDELKNLVLFDTGIKGVDTIYLSDVADVFLADNSADIYAKINNNNGVILSFSKQSTYATAEVSDNVNSKFKELEKKYDGLKFFNLSDQGDYIKVVVNVVMENLIFGAILAILILLLFLRDIKPTFIIACSIPISVLFALVLMYFSGITLNIISLSGLAIGVGMLVDNSVVVIENIYRMRNEGASAIKAAVHGTVQVTGAIVASTLTTICVFLPIVFVEGLTRQLFVDMALTIAYSLLASLIVAITLVPAMASGMLKKSVEKEHKLFNKMLGGYERLARVSLKHKWVALTLSVVLLVGSTVLCISKGFIFMPSMSGNQVTVSITAPKDSTFKDKTELADAAYARVSQIEDIETLGVIISSDSMSMMGGGGDISMYAILNKNTARKDAEVSKDIIKSCEDLNIEITAQGAMDMGSYMTSMSGSGISVEIFGTELDNLIAESDKISGELKKIDGIGDIATGVEDVTPEIRIIVDKEKAMGKGMTVAQVYAQVAAGVKAETTSTNITIENFQKDIIIKSEKNSGVTVNDVKKMKITVTDKEGKEEQIALSSVAKIQETKTLNSINRDNQRRSITVSAGIKEGYNITKMTDTVTEKLSSYEPMEGNTIEIGGESDSIMDAMEQLVYMALLAIAIIYAIMVAQFQSLRLPFIVMFTIPLAFTGGFLALLITGKELSVISVVGFVMLAGIIVNNGIVLIDYINTLRLEGVEKTEAIIQAGKTRMRPILMTALTTVLGLMSMALSTGFGAEMMQPMAIVCIGGLVYATIMTLFVVPTMYDILSRKEMKKTEIE